MKIILIAILLFLTSNAFAGDANNRAGVRYASMRSDEINVRAGPGTNFPILWVYQRSGYPVKIIAEHHSWYKISDPEGEQGWIYKNLLSKSRNVIIGGDKPIVMYRKADGTKPLMRLEPGVVLGFEVCGAYMCKVEYNGTSGWVAKKHLLMAD